MAALDQGLRFGRRLYGAGQNGGEQRLLTVAQIGDRTEPGYPSTALEGVQLPVELAHQRLVVRISRKCG